ncbi:MAG: Magnesium and cobalt efflux protein CorC [Chlamydiae bacterium]|nr:Magnesium and cobalt efflux protein CorC [Chlamydiota bacterium]
MTDPKLYFFLTILFLLTQGVFAMLEMACVSFNKVRLQYFVKQNKRRAKWLHYLLDRPTLLFGATLIGVNASLQIGSECSRRFYDAIGLNPDWAPLTQILLVIVIAELAPMFAGRRYAEHAAMLGVPILYVFSFILRPLIWFFDLICRGINALLRCPIREGLYLSREDLQHMFEQREEEQGPTREINTVVANIFSLKEKVAKELMSPLGEVQMVPSFCTVGEMRTLLNYSYTSFLPIYQRDPRQVQGIVYPRDLLRITEEVKVRDYARPAWFITENSSILQILKQFRRNNQSIAVVLNDAGHATGFLTLDEIIDSIFGKTDDWESFEGIMPRMHHVIVDRTFPGDMHIKDFNRKYHVHLEPGDTQTLEELVEKKLGHPPEKGESVHIDQFELTVEDAPLLGPKKIAVRTVY